MFKNIKYLIIISSALILSGCTGLAIGAGAGLGLAAAQEGGIKSVTNDVAIRAQIADNWLRHDLKMFSKVDMTVKEGRVLLTGVVDQPEFRIDAVRLAWQAKGVTQVINEINIADQKTIVKGTTSVVKDGWITTNLKTRMAIDRSIQSLNFSIDTVNNTVYLMGVAQDEGERDRVIDKARNTKYVANVISYIRLRGETPLSLQTTDINWK